MTKHFMNVNANYFTWKLIWLMHEKFYMAKIFPIVCALTECTIQLNFKHFKKHNRNIYTDIFSKSSIYCYSRNPIKFVKRRFCSFVIRRDPLPFSMSVSPIKNGIFWFENFSVRRLSPEIPLIRHEESSSFFLSLILSLLPTKGEFRSKLKLNDRLFVGDDEKNACALLYCKYSEITLIKIVFTDSCCTLIFIILSNL